MKLRAAAILSTLLWLVVCLMPAPIAAVGSLSMNLSQGIVGTVVSIPNTCAYGIGAYQIYWGETDLLISEGEIKPDCGLIYFTVPEAPRGKHKVTLRAGGDYFTSEFTIVPSISLSTNEGTVGSNLTASGRGFNANESGIQVIYDDSPAQTDIVASSRGSWQSTFKVPSSSRGKHVVDAKGITPATDVEDQIFTIFPKIEINPTSGWVGTAVGIAGSGFGNGETNIKVTYDGVTVKTGIPADAKGSWQSSFSVPTSTKGSHQVNAYGAITPQGDVITVTFNVSPGIKLEPVSGYLGDSIHVEDALWVIGVGFEANETGIKITFDGTLVASNIIADAKGSWTNRLEVPPCTKGEHAIDASGEITQASDTADSIVIISPNIHMEPTSGAIGNDITIRGTGFSTNQIITIRYDGTQVATGTGTDTKGNFIASFKIPTSKAGDHIVTVTDPKGSAFSTSLSVESIPPATPHPTSPEPGSEFGFMDTKTISFDWSDVEDPSGIYYVLEISSSADFAGAVIRKEGLTASEYTLTKEENLAQGDYYWRIKAVDGAGNESEWTNGQLFKVGGIQWWLPAILAVVLIVVIGIIWRFVSVSRRSEWK